MFLKVQLTHLTGPGVTQDSSHINWGVRHNWVIVELFLGLVSVFKLQGKVFCGKSSPMQELKKFVFSKEG